MKLNLKYRDRKIDADVKRSGDTITVTIDGKTSNYDILAEDAPFFLFDKNGELSRGYAVRQKSDFFVHTGGHAHRLEEISEEIAAGGDSQTGDLKVIAPMPGTIIKVLVNVGAVVKKGEPLIVVEAMKMENEVKASGSATVEQILVSAGERVGFGQELIKLAPVQEDSGQAKSS